MLVLVPMADGFEEIEFVTIVDILRRAGLDVVTAALKKSPVEGSHKIEIVSDALLDDIDYEKFDALVLPGGFPGFVNLGEDERILRLVSEMNEKRRYVAAICGGPSVFIKAGILDGRKATINPAGRAQMKDDQHVDERVVVDGNIITSKAVGTALEFALELVGVFVGIKRKEDLAKEILART